MEAKRVPITELLRKITLGSYSIDDGNCSSHYAVGPLCREAADTIDMLQAALDGVGAAYAHRLAVALECALLDKTGHWDMAHKVLDEYREATARAGGNPPTFMGEAAV